MNAEPEFDEVLEQAQRLSNEEKRRLVEAITQELGRGTHHGGHVSEKRSLYGALREHGPAPSAEEIDEARREAWSGFPRDDI